MSEPKVNRATVIEWLDANEIEVTHTQLAGLFSSAIEAAQTQEDASGWMRDGALLYRLTGEHRPTNFDEIRVTMANGSRDIGQMSVQAERLLAMLTAPQPPTSAEPTQPAAWKMDKDTFQFLSDVMTAAGLVEHGKQCKALAKRLNSGVMAVRETFQARWAPDPDQKIVKVDCGDYYQWQAAPAQALPEGRAALITAAPQPVAELVTTAHGFETTLSLLPGHFDLPYGTHLLYAAPQPASRDIADWREDIDRIAAIAAQKGNHD